MNTKAKTLRELHAEEQTEARIACWDRLIADMEKKQREWDKQDYGLWRFPIRFVRWVLSWLP